ncbi:MULTISPECIES: cytochrome C [Ramlibacter]|uniref:cytochrome C n=1 Tax=Ramlibacter TaxID=174951 RepID=UPI001D0FF3EF|nr:MULTISPECIES: cytochrome C [Ramlibacter]
MKNFLAARPHDLSRWRTGLRIAAAVLALCTLSLPAAAVPAFARQTGQNCLACHAGGQFPELTPYGRLFKMTGYTMGQRTVPLSAMATLSNSRVANTAKSDDPASDFQKNGSTLLDTASIFLAGKITDQIGGFAQVTYDPYATQGADGQFHGHSSADNIDLRFADRFIDKSRDLIVGLSLNNNPSVSDPWNTAPAWMQYVPVPSPTSSRFVDGNAPYPGYAAGSNIAGLTGYLFLNRTWYAELGAYGSSHGILSFMHGGVAPGDRSQLQGLNPYWRLAWNHEWGPHALMLGTAGMHSRVFDDPLDTSDSSTLHHVTDILVDAQYQYLFDPHSVTLQAVFQRSRHRYPDSVAGQPVDFVDAAGNPLPLTNAVDTLRTFRAKATYVYQARYGGSVGVFNLSGSTNTLNVSSGYSPDTLSISSDPSLVAVPSTRVGGNLSGNPGTRGATFELFWTPIQYLRLGAQYTAYTRYNGASHNYDGLGRNASDNNTLFVYLWAAY